MPDSQPPSERFAIKVKDYCIRSARGAGVTVANMSMHGCTFRIENCMEGCAVSDLNITYPSYHREVS